MYLKTPGSIKSVINDLYTVWLPPLPPREFILGHDLKRQDQFWRRTPIPKFYDERRGEEMFLQEKEKLLVDEGVIPRIKHFDPVLEQYRRQEWTRRIYGVYVMINGVPTYLTGTHYSFLQWCKLDHSENDGYPLFFSPQVPRFQFRQLCWEDPYSLGYLIVGGRGFGKCLGLGTKVRMYHGGVKNVEDVVVGDLLMGPDSTPRTVLKLHTGEDDMYEVQQNQAMNYVVNSEHIISLRRNSCVQCTFTIKKGQLRWVYPQYGDIANVPLYELITKSETFFDTFSGYKVGVEYEEKPIEIDPYFLGLWLGDGTSSSTDITSMDQEIVDYVHWYGNELDLKVTTKEISGSNRAKGYAIVRRSPQHQNTLRNLLKNENLIQNKHIPDKYLYNTRKIRLELLAGLIDTDGHYHNGGYEIVQVRKHLAEQIKMLADTLGYKTHMAIKTIDGDNYYRLNISGCGGEIPVKLPRKKGSANPNKDHRLTKINRIEYKGRGQYYGFELDGDRLFLLEDGTVTHNTAEEAWCQLENMTKPGHNRAAAIQSKNKEEAEEVVFQEKMVPMFNALPDFFKPQFSHGSDPKKAMVFKRPSVKGKEARKVKHGNEFELGNSIHAFAPHNKALDSRTLTDIINDEIGKLNPEKDQDAYTRHSTNIRSVFRFNKKNGIIRATTTIEEMEQGGDECEEIWIESDPRVRDQNGYTTSRIYRYFVSATEIQTQIADKYGNIQEDAALKIILNEREPVKNNAYKLALLMRKNPITEQEAFLRDQNKSIYDVMILSKRLGELKLQKADQKFKKYNPEWVNGQVDGDVELVPHPQGVVTLFYEPDVFWSKERKLLNACQYTLGNDGKKKLWIPCNNDMFRASTDPIKWRKTDDPRASKMAAHGMLQYIPDLDNGKPLEEWISKNIMWEYLSRKTDPDENYEDIIKLMKYFGHSIMPEGNASEFNKHAVDRGYQKFIIVRRDFDPTVLTNKHTKNSLGADQAVHSTDESIESYVRRTAAFIRRHGHRLNSIPLIEQLLRFDPKKPTSTDLAVSFGYGILALEAHLDDYFTTQKDTEKVMDYFKQYDISGNQSRQISTSPTGNIDNSCDFDDPNYLNAILTGRN